MVEANLAGLHTDHLVRDFDPPNLRLVVVKQLLLGNTNLKSMADTGLDRATAGQLALVGYVATRHSVVVVFHAVHFLWLPMGPRDLSTEEV